MQKIAGSLFAFFLLSLTANAFTVPDKPIGHVNDYANVLTLEVKNQLEESLRVFTASTTSEIAVVTVPDLGGDTIERYAVQVFEKWKIGNAKNDNGVLLLVAINDRQVRIEVGYGLEGALPDITSKNIIETQITPAFKEGNYSLGILQGVNAIKEATKGEYVATAGNTKSSSFNLNSIEIILVVGFFVLQFIISIFARSKSWWAGGILGGLVGGAITFFSLFGVTVALGIIITIILILLGLIFDYIVSNAYTNSASGGGGIPWWAGGGKGGGYSGSSGTSFGGFGGGSTGGGGASGRW